MNSEKFLVVMSVPSIKKYVFGTERLVEIRGASGLLEYLYRQEVQSFLQNSFKKENVNRVFVGGGAALFIIEAPEKELETGMRKLEKLFCAETGDGLRLVWGHAPFTEGNFLPARIEAENRAMAKQEEAPFLPTGFLHTGYVGECESCADVAVYTEDRRKEERLLCRACHKKDEFGVGKKDFLWDEFTKVLKDKGFLVERPETFEDIGKLCRAKPGYTAVIYADGNAMGKLIQGIDSRNRFQFFSKTVEDSIRGACHETLFKLFFSDRQEIPEVLPADILLLGGDDLVVYMKAESALDFAVKAAQKFNEMTRKRIHEYTESTNDPFFKEKLGDEGLSISLGIAYGKSHTPLSILLDQADQLLTLAKNKGWETIYSNGFSSPSYIDFHLSTNFNQICVRDSRVNHLEIQGLDGGILRLSQKPYSLDQARKLLFHARNLVKNEIPNSRLKRLGAAPTLGKVNATVECLKLIARMKKKEDRAAVREALKEFGCLVDLPWRKYNSDKNRVDTVLLDLVEIAQLCGSGSSDEKEKTDAA